MRIRNLLIIVGVILSSIMYGQDKENPGFLITNQGDTLNTDFQDLAQHDLSYKVVYYDTLIDDWSVYWPGAVKQFNIENGDQVYLSRNTGTDLPDSVVFLRCLVAGDHLTLFQYTDENSKNIFFAETREGDLYRLKEGEELINGYYRKNNQYIGQLKNLMIDQPELFPEIEAAGYTRKELIELFEKYHTMRELHFSTNYKSRRKITSNMQLGGLGNIFGWNVGGSFFVELSNPDILAGGSIRSGLNYRHVYRDYTDSPNNFNYVSLDYLLQYKFKRRAVYPYLFAGISASILNTSTIHSTSAEEPSTRYRHQFVTGGGVAWESESPFSIYLELRNEIFLTSAFGFRIIL